MVEISTSRHTQIKKAKQKVQIKDQSQKEIVFLATEQTNPTFLPLLLSHLKTTEPSLEKSLCLSP
jgi:hypothetical protein